MMDPMGSESPKFRWQKGRNQKKALVLVEHFAKVKGSMGLLNDSKFDKFRKEGGQKDLNIVSFQKGRGSKEKLRN